MFVLVCTLTHANVCVACLQVNTPCRTEINGKDSAIKIFHTCINSSCAATQNDWKHQRDFQREQHIFVLFFVIKIAIPIDWFMVIFSCTIQFPWMPHTILTAIQSDSMSMWMTTLFNSFQSTWKIDRLTLFSTWTFIKIVLDFDLDFYLYVVVDGIQLFCDYQDESLHSIPFLSKSAFEFWKWKIKHL